MVVEDQMPEKDLTSKSDVYISAMFEILVDASQGETPMGKLLRSQNIADAAPVAKVVNKVAAARERSVARNKA
jgi:chorismate-pyruvate lyase